ncbi:unnamed protein product, partial [Lactuca virosa]
NSEEEVRVALDQLPRDATDILDILKAKHTLKNLRVKTSPTNTEYKITGLSEKPCNEQLFSLRQKLKDENGEFETLEVTVYDYFVNYRKIELQYSGELPCVNVGKPKRPTLFPLSCAHWSLYNAIQKHSTRCKDPIWWRNPDKNLKNE